MLSIAHVGIPPAQLAKLVEGEVWERWLTAEPDLAAVSSLAELDLLRGSATDGPLGALVRLAARDGGDDELAAIAVVHQLEGGVRRLVHQFRNLTDDVEAVVIGALWETIRTFPWRRRTRSFAANLIYDTRTAVVALLLPGTTRRGPEPSVLVDPQTWAWDALAGSEAARPADDPGAAAELADLLDWAIGAGVVTRAEARLLDELVAAGRTDCDDGEPRWAARGACSVAAVAAVAARRGRCARTVVRQRDQVVARLREAKGRYLAEAA